MQISDEDIRSCGRVFKYLTDKPESMRKLKEITCFIPVIDWLRTQRKGRKQSAKKRAVARRERRKEQIVDNQRKGEKRKYNLFRQDGTFKIAKRPLSLQSHFVPCVEDVEEVEKEEDNTVDETHDHDICMTKNCYGQKGKHPKYVRFCDKCAIFNLEKRHNSMDLTGRVAIVTGARIKIGFEVALKLLRAGATVIATTRFPVTAAERYSNQPDFAVWKDRLTIYGIDFRDIPGIVDLVEYLDARTKHIDILINNAAQTIRRPPAFYHPLIQQECNTQIKDEIKHLLGSWTRTVKTQNIALELPARKPISSPPFLSLVETTQDICLSSVLPLIELERGDSIKIGEERDGHIPFPVGSLDSDGQQLDLRLHNSWKTNMTSVSPLELIETQVINAAVPAILCAKLKPLLKRSPFARKFIVNVSAMEGQFYRNAKTNRHPHTNMAKASLNMLTRTCAAEYLTDLIFMTSVDTGWCTDENPHTLYVPYVPPLDNVDGAARILDPIFSGIEKKMDQDVYYGVFLKDYVPTQW